MTNDQSLEDRKDFHREFLRKYFEEGLKKVLAAVEEGRVPPHWDGHELRMWVTELMTHVTEPMRDRRGARRKAYEQACIDNFLP